MKVCRESKTNEEKESERGACAQRKKVCRDLKSDAEKEKEKGSHVNRMRLCRKRKRDADEELHMAEERNQKRVFRENEKNNCGRLERLKKFRNSVKYGAIFVCSSCHQRLFENGVTLITTKFKEDIETKKPGLYEDSVQEIEQHMRKTTRIIHMPYL